MYFFPEGFTSIAKLIPKTFCFKSVQDFSSNNLIKQWRWRLYFRNDINRELHTRKAGKKGALVWWRLVYDCNAWRHEMGINLWVPPKGCHEHDCCGGIKPHSLAIWHWIQLGMRQFSFGIQHGEEDPRSPVIRRDCVFLVMFQITAFQISGRNYITPQAKGDSRGPITLYWWIPACYVCASALGWRGTKAGKAHLGRWAASVPWYFRGVFTVGAIGILVLALSVCAVVPLERTENLFAWAKTF